MMSFSSEFIKILDELGKRFGIIVDWTQKNITPYITELSKRIITYEITMDILIIIITLLFTIAPFFYYSKIGKSYSLIKKDKEDNFFFENSFGSIEMSFAGVLLTTFIGVFHIFFMVGFLCSIMPLIKDIILPETILLDYIKNFSNILN